MAISEIIITVAVFATFISYIVYLRHEHKRHSPLTLLGKTKRFRRAWVESIMTERRDILAVQTLRNLSTTSSFFASTAILISIGLLTFFVNVDKIPEALHALNFIGKTDGHVFTIKILCLSVNFFVAFFNFSLTLRYYNYVVLIINVPAADKQTIDQVEALLDRSALHHALGMRCFYFGIPLTLWLFGPLWMLIGAAILFVLLYRLDRLALP